MQRFPLSVVKKSLFIGIYSLLFEIARACLIDNAQLFGLGVKNSLQFQRLKTGSYFRPDGGRCIT
jgi:hypothetical protein